MKYARAICGLPRSTILFSHYLIKGTIKKKKNRIFFFDNFCLQLFSF